MIWVDQSRWFWRDAEEDTPPPEDEDWDRFDSTEYIKFPDGSVLLIDEGIIV
jgi:hypothetical protein